MNDDLKIAQAATLEDIYVIAEKAGIAKEFIEPYGTDKAKISPKFNETVQNNKDGKLILVTAITPTKAGEGKSTTTVGLADGLQKIGKNVMACNPSVGGPAKGIVVREIDALGGQMPVTADRTALQFKMLNSAKGPGVRALRVQSDKIEYKKMMQDVCLHQENLDVLAGML